MALEVGTRLGHYDVTALLGEGGMGQVWQATDTQLNRQVALKILPDAFADDPDRLVRFQREAQVLASLNHPNIAAIYGIEKSDDTRALVLELVEGPTLADRIAKGPIPLDEALPIAKQIAEALEAAHEQGIIHRDLKPANVKLRPDGTVKVLDFGLAKALEPTGAMSPGMSQAPTITTPAMTQAGMILGTAAYMSPEQARGKPVDRRTDIWAFGAVLYEMLTGKRAFPGSDTSEVLAGVIKSEPDWDVLPLDTPPLLLMFLKQCLKKDSKQRVGDIRDVRLALEGAFDTTAPPMAATVPVARPAWRRAMPFAAALGVGVVIAALAAWSLWPTPAAPRVTRLTIARPVEQPLILNNNNPLLTLSPDGTRVVYRVRVDGDEPALMVRALDTLEATRLYQPANSILSPFFSPDGAWVGFSDQNDDTIKRIAVTGGPALTIGEVGSTAMRGATWGEDGTIMFGTAAPSGLWQVPSGGGAPAEVTTLDEAQGESNHLWPELLPGDGAVLFTVLHEGEDIDAAQIAVRDLASGAQRVLVSGGSYPKYAPTGHLVYAFQGTIRAVPFNVDALAVTGDPVGVLDGVRTLASGAAEFALARNGSLVYMTDIAQGRGFRSLVWVDRDGRVEPLAIETSDYSNLNISPDGSRVAVDDNNLDDDLWVWDFAGETRTRLTVGGAGADFPVWSVAGDRIAYQNNMGGIDWKAASNTGSPKRLAAVSVQDGDPRPSFFSPTGTALVFQASASSGNGLNNIGLIALEPGAEPIWLLREPFNERNADLSPDGRWMAYESDESGEWEVYVRPFPNVDDDRVPVSNAGGLYPRWSRDGRELFYIEPGPRLMSVAVEPGGPVFSIISRSSLLDWPYLPFGLRGARPYDVSQDGLRFLGIREGGTEEAVQPQIILVQNWHEELKRLVPNN